jgi:hypothetical protein
MGASARQRGGRPSYAEERKAARHAELAALCSLITVLLWGACLIPLPAGELYICCAFNIFQVCSLPGSASLSSCCGSSCCLPGCMLYVHGIGCVGA